jgi:uncharacterized protein
MSVALIDASPLVALLDQDDAHHTRYNALLADRSDPPRLYSTWPCIAEATHLLGAAASRALLRWVGRGGVQVFPFNADAVLKMADWMERYTSVPRTRMDFADATLYWLAVETGVNRVLTLDRRDFSRYRLPDGRAFEIL